MNVGADWVASVNYWLRRMRVLDSGGYLDQPPGLALPIPQRLGWFELKTNLEPGGTADAYFRTCTDGTTWATDTAQGLTRIIDRLGHLGGVGRDTTGTSGGAHGSYVLAIHDDHAGSNVQTSDLWIAVAIDGADYADYAMSGDGGAAPSTPLSTFTTHYSGADSANITLNPGDNTEILIKKSGTYQFRGYANMWDRLGVNTTPRDVRAQLYLNGAGPVPFTTRFVGDGKHQEVAIITALIVADADLTGGPDSDAAVVTIVWDTDPSYTPVKFGIDDGELIITSGDGGGVAADVSGVVPYSGATQDVDLGSHSISTAGAVLSPDGTSSGTTGINGTRNESGGDSWYLKGLGHDSGGGYSIKATDSVGSQAYLAHAGNAVQATAAAGGVAVLAADTNSNSVSLADGTNAITVSAGNVVIASGSLGTAPSGGGTAVTQVYATTVGGGSATDAVQTLNVKTLNIRGSLYTIDSAGIGVTTTGGATSCPLIVLGTAAPASITVTGYGFVNGTYTPAGWYGGYPVYSAVVSGGGTFYLWYRSADGLFYMTTGAGVVGLTGMKQSSAGSATMTGYGVYAGNTATCSPALQAIWPQYGLTVANCSSLDNAAITTDGIGNITATSFVKTGGTSGQFLKANGSVDSTTYLSGTVAATSGGTGITTYTTGDTLYASATNTLTKLAGNTTTTMKALTQKGTGSASAAPVWTSAVATATVSTIVTRDSSANTAVNQITLGTTSSGGIAFASGGCTIFATTLSGQASLEFDCTVGCFTHKILAGTTTPVALVQCHIHESEQWTLFQSASNYAEGVSGCSNYQGFNAGSDVYYFIALSSGNTDVGLMCFAPYGNLGGNPSTVVIGFDPGGGATMPATGDPLPSMGVAISDNPGGTYTNEAILCDGTYAAKTYGPVNLRNLPNGTLASPPGGLSSGDAWLDTTDSATHPILRVML